MFTPERHLPTTPGQRGHSHQRHTAAGTAAPTTTDTGNRVPQRANPTQTAYTRSRKRAQAQGFVRAPVLGLCFFILVPQGCESEREQREDPPRVASGHVPRHVRTGASDVHTGAPDVHTGVAAVHTGVSDVRTGASDVHSGTSDVHTGAFDVRTGASDVHTGAASVHTGTSDVHTGGSAVHTGHVVGHI